jgi:plasmid stabilization system protein ParE
VRVSWKRQAIGDLKLLEQWLSSIPDAKSARTIERIKEAARSLARLGDIGRPSKNPNSRELSVRNAPYVLVYERREDHFMILSVFHAAQDR